MAHMQTPTTIPLRYLQKSSTMGILLVAVSLVGLVGFGYGLTVDPQRVWQSYVANWLFFTGVAQGAVMFAVATTIVKAKWNWSVRRISLAFVAFLPVSFILLLPMVFVLRADYFPWIEMMEYDYLVQKKAAYLNIPFLTARSVGGTLLLFGMSLYFAFLSLRPDQGRAAEQGGGDARIKGWVDRLTLGWTGQDAEEERSQRTLNRLSPAIALAYAAVMSFLIYDWAMTLMPHWFSTLFGGWYFMGSFLCGVTATALLSVYLRRRDTDVSRAVGSQQLHDLGKLSFAFTAFWAYLFFSQYVVIWYGKLPWEQSWIIRRSGEVWGGLSLATIILVFIIPFAGLMGRAPKRTPAILGTFALVSLVGMWTERYLLVAPSLSAEGPAMVVWQPLVGMMFLGVFLLSIRWFLSTFPLIQVWQPKPQPELLEAEVRVGAD